jgi:hypothetical protein
VSLRWLIACERSGVVRRAIRARGHFAMSADFHPAADDSPDHYQGDVRDVLGAGWDGLIAFPDCTYLTSAGLHWNTRRPERAADTEAALAFVQFLLDQPIERIALENPVGCISTRIRKPDQIIQPYEFGHDASKATCLWLKNLAPLVKDPAKRVAGRVVNGRERWANQTDSGQNRLPPSANRAALRAETYAGVGEAMAEAWCA